MTIQKGSQFNVFNMYYIQHSTSEHGQIDIWLGDNAFKKESWADRVSISLALWQRVKWYWCTICFHQKWHASPAYLVYSSRIWWEKNCQRFAGKQWLGKMYWPWWSESHHQGKGPMNLKLSTTSPETMLHPSDYRMTSLRGKCWWQRRDWPRSLYGSGKDLWWWSEQMQKIWRVMAYLRAVCMGPSIRIVTIKTRLEFLSFRLKFSSAESQVAQPVRKADTKVSNTENIKSVAHTPLAATLRLFSDTTAQHYAPGKFASLDLYCVNLTAYCIGAPQDTQRKWTGTGGWFHKEEEKAVCHPPSEIGERVHMKMVVMRRKPKSIRRYSSADDMCQIFLNSEKAEISELRKFQRILSASHAFQLSSAPASPNVYALNPSMVVSHWCWY